MNILYTKLFGRGYALVLLNSSKQLHWSNLTEVLGTTEDLPYEELQ